MRFVGMSWAAAAVVGAMAVAFGTGSARAQAPASVSYAPEAGARQLIFVNNPEKIVLRYTDAVTGSVTRGITYDDLADPGLGQKALFRMTLNAGSYRDNFEHVYRGFLDSTETGLGTAAPAHYAVHLYNPNSAPIFVTIVGKGFQPGTQGGRPLAEMLNDEAAGNPAPVTYRVAARRALWLMRTDIDYGNARALIQGTGGTFFSGAVDFDVSGGQFVVTHLAYQNYRSLTSWTDMGFNVRAYPTPTGSTTPPAPESRVYKGLMASPGENATPGGVVANLTFTVGAGTAAASELPVTYPRYVNDGAGNFSPSPTVTVNNSYWVTHNIPSRRPDPVSNDMFDTLTPEFTTVFALSPFTAPNTPFREANIANWGILYHDRVTVVNNDTRQRTFSLTLNNFSTSGGNIAYQNNSGVWAFTRLQGIENVTGNPLPPFTYRTFTVPAGETRTVDGFFILGSPSVGTVRHAVQVTN